MPKNKTVFTILTILATSLFLTALICLALSPMLLIFLIDDQFTFVGVLQFLTYYFLGSLLYNTFLVFPASLLIRKEWWPVLATIVLTTIVIGLATFIIETPSNDILRIICGGIVFTVWLAGIQKLLYKTLTVTAGTFKQMLKT